MKRYQTIIVAAGLDERDRALLRHAAWFAQVAEARTVYLAHVAPSFDLPAELTEPAIPVDEEITQRLRNLVDAQPGLFPEATQVQIVARQGSLVSELVRLAAQKSADLFCLGRRPSHDPDPLSESALQLVQKMACSVFVIPSGTEPHYQRILVPIDFSEHAREALEVACALARAVGDAATVTAQHAYEMPLGWHKSGRSAAEFAAIMKRNAERHWQEFLPTVQTQGVTVQLRLDLSEQVPVAQTILAAADAVDAQLLVLGSHGRTRPASVLLGHVADTVCARTTRPILCVKKKGEVVNFLRALLQFFELERP